MSQATRSATEPAPGTRLALITGATGGIGKATCHALAGLGISIAAHYHAAKDDAEALVKDLEQKYSVRAACFQADMGDYDAVRALHANVVSALGHPNILFLNAGTTGGLSNVGSLANVPIDVFERTWRINCGSPILLTQLSLPNLPALSPSFGGRIILTSSVAAFTGGRVGPHYASSKSALHGFVHWLASHVASASASASASALNQEGGTGTETRGEITVNAIAPALIADTAMLPGDPAALARNVPLGRLGRPEEVAETVVWMVKTGYVASKVVAVDGGMYVQ